MQACSLAGTVRRLPALNRRPLAKSFRIHNVGNKQLHGSIT